MLLEPLVGRQEQLEDLETLLGLECGIPVQSVYVYGDSGSGKTFCVKHALRGLNHVWLNCIEILMPRCAFSSIINSLKVSEVLEKLEDITKLTSCDTSSDFIRIFTQTLPIDEKLFIVFDDAHRLRDLDLLTFFLRLQELSKRQVCCIFISTVPFSHLVSTTDFFWPHEVHLPNYSQEELCGVLIQAKAHGYSDEFYESYVKLVISMFKNVTTNAKELVHIAKTNFEYYAAPCKLDPDIQSNSLKLWKNIEPYLKNAMDTVYLRDTDARCGNSDGSKMAVKQIIELPFYSKFLLIAAYLASYNPASTDKKFFVKRSNREKRKSSAIRKQKPNYHLLGPRPFPLNRLLAIFHAIVDSPVEPRTVLSSQVSSLVHHKLITQAAARDPLSEPRYKCCVDFDYITAIAKTVKFPVVEHLEDFNM
ncbi:origin recognition complex subunit 5 [Galendromus occidentalis]|uniref:Origin recognition complex subunit 5 n=1 Tax=Galendromus occidentalis TaxID=34638 RepID=A0AAJ7PAS2_9ACAR|nr:origin recognition complex subunit 5 [Galendromus occidentalis]